MGWRVRGLGIGSGCREDDYQHEQADKHRYHQQTVPLVSLLACSAHGAAGRRTLPAGRRIVRSSESQGRIARASFLGLTRRLTPLDPCAASGALGSLAFTRSQSVPGRSAPFRSRTTKTTRPSAALRFRPTAMSLPVGTLRIATTAPRTR